MIQIIDGVAFESKPSPFLKLRAHDLGNGQMELTAVRGRVLEEMEMSPLAMEHYLEAVQRHRDETEDERARQSLESAAKRAKTRVRRLCKAMAADTLLTLTYRANVTDLAVCKANLKEFVRRLRRVLPDFKAIACFEQQERGAWHVHMATLRFPAAFVSGEGFKMKSFNVIRAIWRSVTKENAGNVDIANSKRRANRTPAKIAAYIAKYISKAFLEGVAGSNRWTKFGDCEVPKPVELGYFPSMLDVVEAAYALIDASHRVVDQHVSKWGDWFFLVVEKPQT